MYHIGTDQRLGLVTWYPNPNQYSSKDGAKIWPFSNIFKDIGSRGAAPIADISELAFRRTPAINALQLDWSLPYYAVGGRRQYLPGESEHRNEAYLSLWVPRSGNPSPFLTKTTEDSIRKSDARL